MTVASSDRTPGGNGGAAQTSTARPDNSLFVIAVLCTLTVSSGAVLLFGLPRPILCAVAFSGYLWLHMNGRIDRKALQFVLVYIVAFIPATLLALSHGDVKYSSVVRLGSSLTIFMLVFTYFGNWLSNVPDEDKIRDLERLLLFYLVFSIIELMFYEWTTELRNIFYHSKFTDVVGPQFMRRELRVYGGRPTGFFSETSYFARFMGIIVSAYMVITRCSFRSLAALVGFLLLTRSVSFLSAAPVMGLALLRSPPGLSSAGRKTKLRWWPNIWIALVIGAIVIGGVIITQSDRIVAVLTGGDGSFNLRILYPLLYLVTQVKNPLIGAGPTPQESVQAFTQAASGLLHGVAFLPGYNAGMAPTILMLIGMGAIGFIIFVCGLIWFQRWTGVLVLLAFGFANLLSGGYNSEAMFVPWGLIMALIIYQRRIAGELAPSPGEGRGVAASGPE